jgi:HK97 gp10 family phage protein
MAAVVTRRTIAAASSGYNASRFELGIRNQQALVANFHSAEREIVDAMTDLTRAAGERAYAIAYAICPVDTSPTADDFAMRDYIRLEFSAGGLVWELGWYAEDFFGAGHPFYAFFVEFGTRFMPARPSLRPAFEQASAELLRDLRIVGRLAA